MHTAVFGLVLYASLSLSFLAPLGAQQISGKVVDAASSQPVVDASVVLLDSKGKIVRGTLTDADGTYSLAVPKPGTCTIRVGGSGFDTWNSPPVELRKGESVNLDVRLVGQGGSGSLAIFHDRRTRRDGVFFTEEEIRTRGGSRFTDLLFNVQGVSVVPLPGNRDYLTVRLFGSRVGGNDAGARQQLEAGSDCPPVLFVDGRWWGSIDETGENGPDLELLPSTLVGIEIYTPTQVPRALNSGRDAEYCGVISVWRRESG